MSSTRDFKSPGIFAENASTVIPPTPIAGVSYRDAVTGADDTPNGWRYGTKVESQDWNQVMFLLTSMLSTMDKQGVLGWTDLVDYAVPAVTFGSNGQLYFAIAASGPSTTPRDPISSPTFWEPLARNGRVVLSTSQTWNVPVAMQSGMIRPKVTVIGGGGGGGRVTPGGGGGGGGGGIGSAIIDLTGVATVAVSIGQGGAGAPSAVGSNVGTPGGVTTFGSYLSAGGGGQGGVPSGGAPGIATLGDVMTSAGPGGSGGLSATSAYFTGSGGGAGGSGAAVVTRQDGENAVGPGGGGSGGGANTAVAARGGNGANGIVIIEW